MKNLLFDEILMLSKDSEKAMRISLSGKSAALILGSSPTTGLLRSVIETFGTYPFDSDSEEPEDQFWLVKFRYNDSAYATFRYGELYALFWLATSQPTLLIAGNRSLIAEWLRLTFEYNLPLGVDQGEPATNAPIDMVFSPYLLDYRTLTRSNWQTPSIPNLSKSQRRAIADYHLGIQNQRPDRAMSALEMYYQQFKVESEGVRGVITAINKLNHQAKQSRVVSTEIELQREIEPCLKELNQLRRKELTIREELIEIANQELLLKSQSDLVRQTLREVDADAAYADSLAGEPVQCPLCSSTFTNGFAEQFKIASQYKELKNTLKNISKEIAENRKALKRKQLELHEVASASTSIMHDFRAKRGEADFGSFLDHLSNTAAINVLEVYLRQALRSLNYPGRGSWIHTEREVALVRRRPGEEIESTFQEFFARNCELLGAKVPSKTKDVEINAPSEGVSHALVAYYVAIVSASTYSWDSVKCPVLIDCTGSAEAGSIPAEFIVGQVPEGKQIVLLCQDESRFAAVEFRSQLNIKAVGFARSKYRKVWDRMQPFIKLLFAQIL